MRRYGTSKLLSCALGLSLAVAYAGCSSGAGAILAFFGITGTGANTCTSVTVRVNLGAAGVTGQTVASLQNSCPVSALLGAGCNVSIVSAGTDVFDFTVSGCTFSDLADLFRCSLSGVSLAQLASFSSIVGDNCSGATPPLCVQGSTCAPSATTTTTMAPTTTTTMAPATTTTTAAPTTTTTIGAPTTTTTSSTVTSSSTTSTTGIGPVTTTTMPPGGGSMFDIVYSFNFPTAPVGALQFDSDYSAAGGEMDGVGAAVTCKKATGFGALEAFNDNDAGQVLSAGFADSNGFSAPRTLMTCKFNDADGVAPAPASFVNTTTDCSDLNSMPVNCFTSVSSVTACACGDSTVNCVVENCDDGPSSQTATCGDGTVNCSQCTSEQCDDGNAVDDGNGCSATCQQNSVCGNNVVEDLFEACDDGGACQFGSNPGAPCTLPAGSECQGGFCQTEGGDGCAADCSGP